MIFTDTHSEVVRPILGYCRQRMVDRQIECRGSILAVQDRRTRKPELWATRPAKAWRKLTGGSRRLFIIQGRFLCRSLFHLVGEAPKASAVSKHVASISHETFLQTFSIP